MANDPYKLTKRATRVLYCLQDLDTAEVAEVLATITLHLSGNAYKPLLAEIESLVKVKKLMERISNGN